MPPAGEAIDDDYVISLLKKDADANQKRYLSTGLGSLLSRKPRGNAPKPNTRFLKHIIRETDSHNAALKAKEEEESRAKLTELRGEKRRRDVERDEGSSKRRRGDDKPGRWASVLGRSSGGIEKRRKESKNDLKGKNGRTSKQDDLSKHKRLDDRHRDDHQANRRQDDHKSRRRSRSRSPRHRKEHKRRSRSPSTTHSGSPRRADEDDSDPLDDIIGPRPPDKSKTRGRGAHKSSDMDSRFDPSYNPKEDVNLEPDEDRDDWDMALEALRDRAKWRAQGADRLRAAGFTDEEVQTWEKGGEKDVSDVRWRRKGEGREWDRGKVVDENGAIDVRADWGRLKGSE